MARIRAYGDNVLIRLELHNRSTPSGLVLLPDIESGPTARKLRSEYGAGLLSGVVLSVGPGTRRHPVEVATGDRVLLASNAGDRVMAGEIGNLEEDPASELRLLRSSQIEAVLLDR